MHQPYLPFPEFRGAVQCEYCLKITTKPHFVVKHFGLATKQMAFCDELCEHSYYLNRMRREGL